MAIIERSRNAYQRMEMTMSRINEKEQIDHLIEELARSSHIPIELYLIGGGALMYHGSKMSTKDLDFIVCSNEEFDELRSVLISMGYNDAMPTPGFSHANVKAMMVKGDLRLDIFLEKVCGKLRLSDNMRSRSKNVTSYDEVRMNVCDKGDIFIFKSITDRPGDTDDCVNLIKHGGIDWNTMLSEIIDQIRSGEQIWITYICDKLHDIAKESMAEIPIIDDIDRLNAEYCDRYMAEHDMLL